MISHAPHVMTLANSIIGVSVLAMPYCFKQCGIILAIVMLTLCSLLSRLSCHYLIKSAVMSRRRNFEYLAFHAFGHMGKFFVELFIIGFLIGTLIAFFVVIGDLGPQIIAKLLNKKPDDIRLSLIIITALFIILPLGMLKNIDSLAIVCTATIGFYFCLVLKVVSDSMDHIFQSDWPSNINYWRSAGLLQCLPIFSMALFCQTQLFEIYESIPNVTLEKMNNVVRGALNICTFVYLFVGFFGYVAYSNQQFSGNILSSFEPSMTSDAMKIGFVLSVIFSFPLVIFPCRASLNSFLFHQVYSHDLTSNHIPETRFFLMTIIIVGVSMITGILMPNIEFVLGFIGSTIGVSICVVCPMLFYLAINTKNTNERLLAQILLFIGIWIMILGTYANLYSIDDSSTTKIAIPTERPLLIQMNNVQFNKINNENNQVIIPQVPEVNDLPMININSELLKKQQVDIINEPQKIPVVTEKLAKQHDLNVPTESDNKVGEIGEKNNKIIKENLDNIEVFNAEEKIKAIEESMNEKQHQDNNEKIINNNKPNDNDDVVQESKENIRLTLERNKIETKKLIEEQKEILQEQKEILEDLKEQKKALNIDNTNEKIKNNKENSEKENKIETKKLIEKQKEILQEPKEILKDLKEQKKSSIMANIKEDNKINQENNEKEKKIETKKLIKEQKEILQEQKEILKDLKENDKIKQENNEKKIDKIKNNELLQKKNNEIIIETIQTNDKNNNLLLKNKTNIYNENLKHDHILKALTMNQSKINNNTNIINKQDIIYKKLNTTNINFKEINSSKPYTAPQMVAKFTNETKQNKLQKSDDNNKDKQDDNNIIKNSEKKSLNQRDILEIHEREKRDTNEETKNLNIKIINKNFLDNKIDKNNNFDILKTRDLKVFQKNQG